MNRIQLQDEYHRRLIEVNDETKTQQEHDRLEINFRGWTAGIRDAAGAWFNGDYYYTDLIDNGDMEDRPMCCGIFIHWKHKQPGSACATRKERDDG